MKALALVILLAALAANAFGHGPPPVDDGPGTIIASN